MLTLPKLLLKNAKAADALASKAEKALDEVAKKQATRKGAVVE
jgi:hypothetical protein